MHRCTTKPGSKQIRQTLKNNKKSYKLLKKYTDSSHTPVLTIPVLYHVIYNTAEQNISTEQISENHKQLNLDFSSKNTDITKIPTGGNYTLSNLANINSPVDSNILFRPVNHSDIKDGVHVVRYATNKTSFANISEVSAEEKNIGGPGPVVNVLNIYICNIVTGQGTVLGMATLGGTANILICMVLHSSVGSITSPNPLIQNYDIGRTLTHEVGHCLSLEHPWETDGCNTPLHTDIPLARNPNGASAELSNGIGQGCNKDNDLNGVNGTNYKSCTENQTVPPGKYELFYEYMDYVSDENMVMFTPDQTVSMYAFTDSDTLGRSVLDIRELTDIIDEPDPGPIVSITSSSSSLSAGVIVGIVAGIILLVAALIWWNVSKGKNTKHLSSYETYKTQYGENPEPEFWESKRLKIED
jgi:predicted Zn-dependent protease